MAYITAEEVKSIRQALKEEFGSTIKFSVTMKHKSSVNIKILESTDIDFTINTEKRGNFFGASNKSPYFDNRVVDTLNRIDEIAKTAPAADGGKEWHDNSDIMVDYFDVAYYISVDIGKWDKPYQYKGEFSGQHKVVLDDTVYVFDDGDNARHFENEAKHLLEAA